MHIPSDCARAAFYNAGRLVSIAYPWVFVQLLLNACSIRVRTCHRRVSPARACVGYPSPCYVRGVRDAGNGPGKRRRLATFAFNFLFVFVSPSKIRAQPVSGVPARRTQITRVVRDAVPTTGLDYERENRDAGTTRVSCFRFVAPTVFAVERPYRPVYTLHGRDG